MDGNNTVNGTLSASSPSGLRARLAEADTTTLVLVLGCCLVACSVAVAVILWIKKKNTQGGSNATKNPTKNTKPPTTTKKGGGGGKKSTTPRPTRLTTKAAPTTKKTGGGGKSRFGEIPGFVMDAMKLDAEQISNILSIINGAEQSNVDWTKTDKNKPVWTYCEDIGDGRGVTIGIAGFTSEDGSAADLIKNYDGDAPDPKTGKKFCKWAAGRANDKKWIEANWKTYLDGKDAGYIKMAMKYKPAFVRSALAIGLLLDASMNAGEGAEGNAWGVTECSKDATKKAGGDEKKWITAFINARLKHFTRNSGSATWRMAPWKKLFEDGKLEMRGVDVCKYAWCNEKGLGKACMSCK